MRDDLVAAAEVYWGTYQDINKTILFSASDPEKELISKDNFSKLSGNARKAAEFIVNMPDDMFLKNGKASKMKTVRCLKKELGCSKQKVHDILAELKNRFK